MRLGITAGLVLITCMVMLTAPAQADDADIRTTRQAGDGSRVEYYLDGVYACFSPQDRPYQGSACDSLIAAIAAKEAAEKPCMEAEALELQTANANVLYFKAGRFERSRNFTTARKYYEALIERFPSDDFATRANDILFALARGERGVQWDAEVCQQQPHIEQAFATARAAAEAAAGAVAEAERLREQHAVQPAAPPPPAPKTTAPADPRTLPPGSVFRDCGDCPEMVVIPSGEFFMGSPKDEPKRANDEGPVHRVKFADRFAAGRYEVTFAEWDACVAQGGCGGYRPGDEGWGRGRRPVINVSWDAAQTYVQWLSRKTGQRYRLLSEAEWEYAARAGTTTPFSTGDTITTDQANFDGNGVDRGKTIEVGSFRPNRFGLYDMHGNVWEWVEDCGNSSYGGSLRNGRAWLSIDCPSRVLRGGSWLDDPNYVRLAVRYRYDVGNRNNYNGFRLARTVF